MPIPVLLRPVVLPLSSKKKRKQKNKRSLFTTQFAQNGRIYKKNILNFCLCLLLSLETQHGSWRKRREKTWQTNCLMWETAGKEPLTPMHTPASIPGRQPSSSSSLTENSVKITISEGSCRRGNLRATVFFLFVFFGAVNCRLWENIRSILVRRERK